MPDPDPTFQFEARRKARAFLRPARGPHAAAAGAVRATAGAPAAPPTLADHTALLASGRELGWRSTVLVEGFRQGHHRSPLTGFSSEFAQYKPYVSGDDPRHLDWHVYGRLDRLCVRQHEAETNLTAHLVVDASGSMAYRSEGAPRSKSDHAALLAAAFARVLNGQGDACGLHLLRPAAIPSEQHVPPALGRAHIDRMLSTLERGTAGLRRPDAAVGTAPDAAPPAAVASALAALVPRLRRRGLVAVFTDGFEDLPPVFDALRLARAARHDLVLVQVVDPQEITFAFTGRKRFRDLETHARLPVAPALVRPRYLDALRTHQDALKSGCRALNVLHVLAPTDRSPFATLFELTQARGPRAGSTRGLR